MSILFSAIILSLFCLWLSETGKDFSEDVLRKVHMCSPSKESYPGLFRIDSRGPFKYLYKGPVPIDLKDPSASKRSVTKSLYRQVPHILLLQPLPQVEAVRIYLQCSYTLLAYSLLQVGLLKYI